MKVIIAGSRRLRGAKARALVAEALAAAGWDRVVTEVVSGGASGIDCAGEEWAAAMGLSVLPFPADWKAHGKGAGPRRNQEMADYADALIAIPHPTLESRGTADMVRRMRAAGKPVYVHEVRAGEGS
jgi:hypothetical protein